MGDGLNKRTRMEPYSVLVIEDQPEIVAYCRRYLSDGFTYDAIPGGKQIEGALKEKEYDLILLDKNFSHLSQDQLIGPPSQAAYEGIEVLKVIKSIDINLPVIMITAYGDQESVSAAFRLGAFDYVEAEILTKDELVLRRKMENAIAGFSARSRELIEKYNRVGLIGKSRAMLEIFKQIEDALKTENTVLLLGEPGVGKDVIARVLYKLSEYAEKPFISCDMTQTSLIEANLFGIKSKSATGVDERKGFFQLANGGILFLNEIGDLPLEMQSKLLVSLEDREFYPIGSSSSVKFNARIIAATNRNLLKALEEGTFRRDLFGRLNQIKIIIPPLSRRREDIPLLVRHFIDHYCQKSELPSLEITDKAMKYLEIREFPGNIRELKYTIEQLVSCCDGVISIKEVVEFDRPKDFTDADVIDQNQVPCYEGKSLMEVEREMIIHNLHRFGGYIKPAHETMEISKAKFYSRINQYHLKGLVKGYCPPI
jgi:DNA-binding NtrC family response regulator